MLLMGRKENFSVSMASNSVKKFVEFSGFSDILLAAQTRVYFNDSSALGANRKFYEQCELPERGIEMLPELNDHEFIFHQPEADIMRRLSHKLDRDLMAVIGTSRTVRASTSLWTAIKETFDYVWRRYAEEFVAKDFSQNAKLLTGQGSDQCYSSNTIRSRQDGSMCFCGCWRHFLRFIFGAIVFQVTAV